MRKFEHDNYNMHTKRGNLDMKIWSTLLMTLAILPCWAVRIDVATMSIGEWYQTATWPSYVNKQAYCEHHGYRFHAYTDSMDTSRPIPWSKVLIILEIMENPDCEWVFWTDADSLIMNSKIKLKWFLDERYDMIVASDFNGINTGQFFIRNCAWSKDFLARVYAKTEYINNGWWEQAAIMDLYDRDDDTRDCKHIKVLKQRAMNSYVPEIYQDKNVYWHKDDFIIHFAGIRGQQMADLMQKYSKLAK